MNYQLNSYVNYKEAETLKEMIFKRVKERSESLTSDVQTDIMNIARESFVSNNNPFSQISNVPSAETPIQETVTQEPEKPASESALKEYVDTIEETYKGVGFTQKALLPGAANQYRTIQEQTSARQIQHTMQEAREGLSNRKSFMGALAFLNSQAAVSLLNKRAGGGLEVIA